MDLPTDSYEITDNTISDIKYGSYNLSHYADYLGIYFGFRHGLTDRSDYLRTLYEITWSEKKRCLEFFEEHKYPSPENGRMLDFSQQGEIYISNDIGLIHLLTSFKGAMRLITLSKLRRDDNTLEGVILTQIRGAHYYSPAASPIYLKKVEGVVDRSELSSEIGPISPAHEAYSNIASYMEEIERDVARFAPTAMLAHKVTRISSRMKPRD